MSTEKDIRDYLHYYIGAECLWEHIEGNFGGNEIIDGHLIESHKATKNSLIKPILSRLEDMIPEHLLECGNMVYDFSDDPELNNHKPEDFQFCAPEQFNFLIKKGYWLFGSDWFDEGIIIDKKTLKQ